MEIRLPYMFKSRARFGNGNEVEVAFVDFTDVTVREVTEEEAPVVLRYSLKSTRPLGYEVRHDGEKFLVPAYQIAFAQANWATHRSPFSVGLPSGLVEYVRLVSQFTPRLFAWYLKVVDVGDSLECR